MKSNIIAKAQTTINAPLDKVWDAFVNPQTIKKYMFGTTVVSDWKQGSPILWKGEWQGKAYEDKGVILELKPKTRLKYSHYSPSSGVPDIPENYHNVTVDLTDQGNRTVVSLLQDNNETEQVREHSEK